MNIRSDVFERTGSDELSPSAFIGLVAFFVLCGVGATAACAQYAAQIGFRPGLLAVLLLGLALPFVGIWISKRAESTAGSLLGFALIAAPIGFLLGPVVNRYSPQVLRNVCAMTAGITAVMGVAGMSFPKVFAKLGGALFIALIGLMLLSLVQMFVPSWVHCSWIDYLGAGIFSLYIGYDMHRATNVPATSLNAADIAISVYLDVLNVFLFLLSLKDDR